MTLSVYALTSGRRVPDVAGVRLRAVRAGAVSAIVADVRRPPAPTPANIRRYHRIVAAIADQLPATLPSRFGTQMSEDELVFILRSRAQTLSAALRQVRGHVQMTLRILDESTRQDTPSESIRRRVERTAPSRGATPKRQPSGIAYLRGLAEEARRVHHVPGFDPVRTAVQRWLRDERVERSGGVVSVYHLVPGRFATSYAKTVRAAAEQSGVRVVISGPFPPYAFSRL